MAVRQILMDVLHLYFGYVIKNCLLVMRLLFIDILYLYVPTEMTNIMAIRTGHSLVMV